MEFGSGSNKMKVQNKKRKSRRNKLEFLGWGSKPLIEFLDSIGKESRQYSQGEVDAIKKKYVACNNLIDPTYKRRILCDERLEKLFEKKIVSRKNVYHLWEVYFRENHVVVNDDAQDNALPLFSLRFTLRFFPIRQYSQGEVDAITKKYVACNNLIDPTYHRRILCDERLEKLFKKKIVSRKNVYHLWEVYFRENHVVVNDDAQDNALPLFSLRLTLRFFQTVKGEVITRAWVAQILLGWERAIHVNIFNGVWQWIQQNEGPEQEEKIHMEHKLEFLGWGSKPLIEFLDSIGKESRQYSEGEVDAIMKKYVACNNLIDPTYKRRILCDERLEKLFKKKIVSRKNVYHLLEVHFRENHVVVDDDAQDIAPPLFSLRLRLRFFESDPTYHRRIMCDERLEKLFKKKIVSRKNVYHLREIYFRENHVVVDDDAQDNAPPLFSLRLTLRFFQSVKGEVITRAWVAQILPGWERAIHVNIFNGVWQWIQQNEGPEQEEKIHMEHKLEFLGWGSKPLIEFLDSIGKESMQYSEGEVDAIMKKYVACNNLIDPTYKRRILCDERLEKLFKKKIVSRKNVYHLLEVHFRENHVVVDDDAQDNAPRLFSLRLRLRFFE
nr:uncharacterized protein At5g08430-like [Ipomoea trifida]